MTQRLFALSAAACSAALLSSLSLGSLLLGGSPALAQSEAPSYSAQSGPGQSDPAQSDPTRSFDADAPASSPHDSYGVVSPDPAAADEATPAPARPAKPRKARVASAGRMVGKAPPMSWDGLPAYDSGSLARLEQLRAYYQQVAGGGGFGPTPPAGIGPGAHGGAITLLRRRLVMEGDLQPDLAGLEVWDPSLSLALQRFQARYDLPTSGTMTAGTRAAMAVSAEQRLAQIDANVARLSGRPAPSEGRYVAVNLPSARVEAVQNGAVARQYTAIVGRPGNESPQVDAAITGVNINPTWTLPWSIIKKEIAPKVLADPGYLSSQRMRVMDFKGNELDPGNVDWRGDKALFTVRQDAGLGNALGQLRIQMPNSEAVYMHDTPTKRLFSSSERFFSHGCVRVQGVNDLAAWVLGSGWDSSRIADEISLGQSETLPTPEPTQVHWTYMTVYVTADGSAHFRGDIYGLDKNGGSMGVMARATPTPVMPAVAVQ